MFFLLLSVVSLVSGNLDPEAFEKELDSSPRQLSWVGDKNEVVWALTNDDRIALRSEDEGQRWTEVSLPEYERSDSVAHSIHISDANENYVFILGEGQFHWVSKDGGKTFERVSSPGTPHFERGAPVDLHETNSKKILIGLGSDGCSTPGGTCYRKLYASSDFGHTWTFVADYILGFSWGSKHGKAPEDVIYACQWEAKSRFGAQLSQNKDQRIHLVKFDKPGAGEQVLFMSAVDFAFMRQYLIVAVVHDDGELGIAFSKDDGEHFLNGQLPPGMPSAQSYSVLGERDGSLILTFASQDQQWGTIFMSNKDGVNYAVSLEYDFQWNRASDFTEVASMDGVFVANVLRNPYDEFGNRELETKISFDNGGFWEPVRAPSMSSDGSPIVCEFPYCSLHLAGVAERYNYLAEGLLSTESAVGLIIGTGNVGHELETTSDEMNTYLSRDGGYTWSEIRKGAYIYQMGNHGAIIVLVKRGQPTDEVLYSWDEGETFKSFRFTEYGPLEVSRIFIEPTAKSFKFILYGHRGLKGVLVSLDFAESLPRQCHGDGTSANDDYTPWTPPKMQEDDNYCVLGYQVTYIRRKRLNACFNPQDKEKQVTMESCACTLEDWECDYGFVRQSPEKLHSPCVPLGDVPSKDPPPTCKPGAKYYVTRGYRKVAGDRCKGGVEAAHSPEAFNCPGGADDKAVAGGSSAVGLVVVVLFVVLLIVIIWFQRDRVLAAWNNRQLYLSSLSFPAVGSASGGSGYAHVEENGGPHTVGLEDDDDHDLISSAQPLEEEDIRAELTGEDLPVAPATLGATGGEAAPARTLPTASVPTLAPPRNKPTTPKPESDGALSSMDDLLEDAPPPRPAPPASAPLDALDPLAATSPAVPLNGDSSLDIFG